MNRNRKRQNRFPDFEALEGRLALSAGMGLGVAEGLVSHHSHALITTPVVHRVPVSFRGHVSISGSTVTTSLTGTIGRDHFTGHGNGTASGTLFEGGDVYLSNSRGSVTLQLSPVSVTHFGRRTRQTVAVVALESTGKYAGYQGSTGTLTSWNIRATPSATSTFRGVFNIA